MEISGIELEHITAKLNNNLAGYYVNNVYLLNPNAALIRLHHSEKPDAQIVLSTSKGIWLTRYELPRTSGGIASKIRKEIPRSKFQKVTQPKGERIAVIEFKEEPSTRNVILEFFGGGNIIVTDENQVIQAVLRPLRVRHRTVKTGEKYLLPPARGTDVTTLTKEDLKPILETDLPVSRWLGRNLALSKKYVEEILARAEINPEAQGLSLSGDDVQKLFDILKEVVQLVIAGDSEPTVVYREGVPADAAPFMLRAYKGLETKRFGTFMEALDEVLTNDLRSEAQGTGSEGLRGRIEELQKSIEQQKQAENTSLEAAEALRTFAKQIQQHIYQPQGQQKEEQIALLHELGASEVASMKGRLTMKIAGTMIETEAGGSTMKIASHIFGEAKRLEEKITAIRAARLKLETGLKELEASLEEQTTEAEAEKPEIRREKAWYERYRWFKTSDGLLAIGGRDASSNSIIIRRYMEENDIVFHADIHGSPFFVLKGEPKTEKSITETAQAVVAFSRAWGEGLAVADAYWIHPQQVKRQAPSGMFLAKGSFLIEGTKNYLRDIKTECAVGIAEVDGNLTVMAGPPISLQRNSLVYVTLVPDKVKASDTAKKIKSELIRLLGEDVSSATYVKQIPLDDFVRSLPAGGGQIVLKGRGEQRYKSATS
ncbi:MAG: NFACT family protein [Thaumarchaeota archaeon]|nr:NFACT family protein [Nitrososphaerota archaeon]MCL5316798.1 NFACT family protein [Nitrososphaerota archaeon]